MHENDGRSASCREVRAKPFDLRGRQANLDILFFDCVQDNEVKGARVPRKSEGPLASPESVQVVSIKVNRVMVAGYVDERRPESPQNGLALTVAGEIRLARLVFDVVS